MKIGKWLLLIFSFWLVVSQSCMKFRITDEKAATMFAENGISLKTNSIIINKTQLHYVQTGADTLPTIIFLHGSPGSWDAFSAYLQDTDLLKKYRMVSIDRPGFGYSTFGNAMNLANQSTIISPLFQVLSNAKPVYLVGHSLGGPLVVQLAADNPGIINAIVILAGSIDPAQEKPERWRTLLMNNPLQYLVPGALRPSNVELWFLKKDLKLLAPRFSEINARVILLHGNKDQLVPYENLLYGKKMFTHAKHLDTLTIVGANHFIPWSHYEKVKNVLMYLNSHMYD